MSHPSFALSPLTLDDDDGFPMVCPKRRKLIGTGVYHHWYRNETQARKCCTAALYVLDSSQETPDHRSFQLQLVLFHAHPETGLLLFHSLFHPPSVDSSQVLNVQDQDVLVSVKQDLLGGEYQIMIIDHHSRQEWTIQFIKKTTSHPDSNHKVYRSKALVERASQRVFHHFSDEHENEHLTPKERMVLDWSMLWKNNTGTHEFPSQLEPQGDVFLGITTLMAVQPKRKTVGKQKRRATTRDWTCGIYLNDVPMEQWHHQPPAQLVHQSSCTTLIFYRERDSENSREQRQLVQTQLLSFGKWTTPPSLFTDVMSQKNMSQEFRDMVQKIHKHSREIKITIESGVFSFAQERSAARPKTIHSKEFCLNFWTNFSRECIHPKHAVVWNHPPPQSMDTISADRRSIMTSSSTSSIDSTDNILIQDHTSPEMKPRKLEGYLYKYHANRSGILMDKWTLRYVSLSRNTFQYARHHDDAKSRDMWDLNPYTTGLQEEGKLVEKSNVFRKSDIYYTFRLIDRQDSSRFLRLSSKDLGEAKAWFDRLSQRIHENRRSDDPLSTIPTSSSSFTGVSPSSLSDNHVEKHNTPLTVVQRRRMPSGVIRRKAIILLTQEDEEDDDRSKTGHEGHSEPLRMKDSKGFLIVILSSTSCLFLLMKWLSCKDVLDST